MVATHRRQYAGGEKNKYHARELLAVRMGMKFQGCRRGTDSVKNDRTPGCERNALIHTNQSKMISLVSEALHDNFRG